MRNLILIAATALAFAAPASATTLASYASVNGPTLAADFEASGVTAGDVMRGPGLLQRSGSTFNSRNWTIGGDADAAVLGGDFLSFDFSFETAVDLTELAVGYDRSPDGPQSVSVDIILNGLFGFSNIFSDDSVDVSGDTAFLDLTAYTDVTSISFFMVGFNATSLAGTFDLENRLAGGKALILSGQVSAVPLPAALPMLAGALGLFGLIRRKG